MTDKVRARATRARRKVDAMIREQTNYTGQRPTIIRVQLREYLALKEVGFVTADDKYSGDPHGLEVRPG